MSLDVKKKRLLGKNKNKQYTRRMKVIVKILLVAAIVGLAYVSAMSILTPINFKKKKTEREKPIIERLIDIRTAQISFKTQYNRHAANFAELEDFLNNGRIPTVLKEGELTEKQREDGLTEASAAAITAKARATGNWKEATEKGLVYGENKYFLRDTTWANAKLALFGENFDVSSIGIVPGTNASFKMDTASVKTASGFDIRIFEASVDYDVYLGDLDKHQLKNLKDRTEKLEKFPGLKVGSLVEVNNYAGNWEKEF